MKRVSVIVFVGVACGLLFSSCKDTVKDLDFTKEYGHFTFTVDTVSDVGPRFYASKVYSTDIEAKLSESGFSLNNVKSVKIKGMTVQTTQSGQDLDYFRRIEIRVSNTVADEFVVGQINLPETYKQTSASFTPAETDLRDIFKQKEVEFRFYGENDLPILPTPVELKVNISFEVKAALGN